MKSFITIIGVLFFVGILFSCESQEEEKEVIVKEEVIEKETPSEIFNRPKLNETQERYVKIAERLYDSDPYTFLKFCYFVEPTKVFLLKHIDYLDALKEFDLYEFDSRIYEESKMDKFFPALQTFLIELKVGEMKSTVKELEEWMAMHTAIFMPSVFGEDASFSEVLEVISLIDDTKEFVLRYVDPKMGQYWGSLASGQALGAYYSFWTYLAGLDKKQRLCFMQKYYTAVCEVVQDPLTD